MRTIDNARDQFDWVLFLVAALLAVVGVVNLYSATSAVRAALSDLYVSQVYWLVGGGILATIVAAVDYRHYERVGYAVYAFGIVLLMLVFVLGRDIRGSSRWIYIGSFSLQPSEFMKLFLIIALAKYLHDDPKSEGRTLRDLAIPALIAAVPVMLVLRQPDLGTALILGLIFVTIAAMTRIRWRSVAYLATFTGIALPVIWGYGLKDYQKQRIVSFLNPEANILGANWHGHNARVAIGAGRVLGEGFMRGTQNQFLFLPDQYSDFPFSVYAEDWGFVGSLLLVGLYAFLVLWSVR
ncbi:MAG TPA: FtsW/RodA/SpoVE family cell cycle protein, partial [Polyangiaceae bacterium]